MTRRSPTTTRRSGSTPRTPGLQQPRQRLVTRRRSTTRRSPTTPRPSDSTRRTLQAYNDRGIAWSAKKEYDKAIADYDEAIRLDPKIPVRLQQPRRRLARQEGVRQGDRRLRRGHPARPQGRLRLQQPRQRLVQQGASTTRRSPTTTEAIRLDPKYASAYNNRGHGLVRTRTSYDKAIADFNEAIRLDPKYALAYTNRGNAWCCEETSTTRPSPTTPRPSGSTPRTPAAYVNRGDAWSAKKELRQGDRRLQRGHPARPERRLWPTTTAATPGTPRSEYDKAIADYTEAIRLDPKNAAAYNNRGDVLVRRRASTTRRSPTSTRPSGSTPRCHGLQQPRRRLVRQEGVRQGDRRLQRGHPARPQVRHGLRQPRHRLVQPRRSTTRRSPTSPRPSGSTRKDAQPYYDRGVAWSDKKEYDKAIADYHRGHPARPEVRRAPTSAAATPGPPRRNTTRRSPTTPRPSGSTRRTPAPSTTAASPGPPRTEYDKAIADYTEAIRLDPDDTAAYANRGYGLVRQEGVRQGDRRLHRGHPTRPRRRRGLYYDRGTRLVRQEGVRQGDRRLQRGHPARPRQTPTPTRNRGIAWCAKQEYDKAIADYTEAIRLDPKDATAYDDRGNAWYAKNEYDKAIADYTEAIRLDPEARRRLLQPRHRLVRQEGVRQGDRRLQRGHPARSQGRHGLLRPRRRLVRQEGVRQGDRRLHRGHPARSQDRRRPTPTAATPGTPRRSTTRRSPTTPRPSGSTPRTPSAYHSRGDAWYAKKEYDKAIADYTEAIRLDPEDADGLQQPRQRLVRQEGVRQGDRRLHRGHPARSRRTPWPTPTAATPGTTRRSTTRPSPTTTRPSGSIPKDAVGLRQPRRRLVRPRRSTTRRSPTSTRRSGSIPKDACGVRQPRRRLGRQEGVRQGDRRLTTRPSGSTPRTPAPTTTAATPGPPRRSTTRRSPTTTRRSGSTPNTPRRTSIARWCRC